MSRKSNRLLLLGAIASGALLVSGCATETAYRPATGTGFARVGYSDHQVEANRFEVTFSGNSYTSRDTVEKYLLYRAAELTVQQGGDYFIMADRNTDHSSRSYTTPSFGGPYGGWGGYSAIPSGIVASISRRSTNMRPVPRSSSAMAPSRRTMSARSTRAR